MAEQAQRLLQWLINHPEWLYGLVGALVLTTVFCTLFLRRLWQRFMGGFRQRRGLGAERRAAKLLRKRGYDILETTPRFSHQLWVNGQWQTFDVTPDFLVMRDGVEYVVEVKRKMGHYGVSRASIRRQVLEYMIACNRPCLLVRMPQGTIDEVDQRDTT